VRDELVKKRESLESRFKDAVGDIGELERKLTEELSQADKAIALYAIGSMVNELIEKYKHFPEVVSYLKDLQEDMVEIESNSLQNQLNKAECLAWPHGLENFPSGNTR
jgi:hypothetical protein